jgi:hypothetical protein
MFTVGAGGSQSVDGSCDLVEINHYQPDQCGGFTQAIAWDWCPQYRRWHAQQWMMVSGWDRVGGVVVCDGESRLVRLSSRLFRETWTNLDPERENQKLFPVDSRRKVW